jgi:CubicO group peptidase (beta-lactamase class C family)
LISASPCIAEAPANIAQPADVELGKLEARGFTGSVLVARDDEVIYARDLGIDGQPEAPPSYWIASITKQFTAAAILRLQEQGELDIHDRISTYLPGVPSDKQAITVFHLLTHTSGLPQNYAADGIEDKAEALRSVLAAELQSAPGTTFSYANDNYNLLAIILEQVSGTSYEEFLRDLVFEPAGMQHSGHWGMPLPDGANVPPVISPMSGSALQPNWGFRGATAMRASVPDLFAFMRSISSSKLLAAGSVDLLMGNHVQTSGGTEVGFNWFGHQTEDGVYMKFSRGQESFGGNAVIYVYPVQRLTIITATNAGPAETGDGPVTGWSRLAHQVLAEIYLAD